MLHETNHILIMAPELWDDFREWNGDLIPHHRVVSEQQEDGLIYIISPGVAQWSKEHFGCPMLIGFPLEDTGSGGSVGAHWDERHVCIFIAICLLHFLQIDMSINRKKIGISEFV